MRGQCHLLSLTVEKFNQIELWTKCQQLLFLMTPSLPRVSHIFSYFQHRLISLLQAATFL